MMTDARDTAYLESYLAEASRSLRRTTLFLYPSGSAESPRVGVLYGAFPTRREANEAMGALPPNLRQFRPYVRSVESVRNDVRRSAGGLTGRGHAAVKPFPVRGWALISLRFPL